MRSARTGFRLSRWALIAVALNQLVVGCGDSTPQCVPGASAACVGPAGCAGYQVCADDGRSYGACTCAQDADGFPSAGPNSGLIGAACEDASSCRVGLECISSHSSLMQGQGPSAGMCLARCLPDHDFCKGLDALSKCVVLDDAGTPTELADDLAYCMPGCELGTQANELDKCRGRIDLVCSEVMLGSKLGYCRPACRGDVDCAGRFCDLATGLCSDSERVGDSIGSSCNPSAGTATCSGGCMRVTAEYAECSGSCSYGTPGCGQLNGSTALDYFCDHPAAQGTGEGDLGYCARLCDCDSDCGRLDAVCEPRPDRLSATSRKGVCGSKSLPSGAPRKNTPC